ncbi:major tail protein [Streptococcus uberis]|uniref:major tail protein n=1 Tax=Streptococcus uberis TaxID=1349 RepID=UPI003D6A160C
MGKVKFGLSAFEYGKLDAKDQVASTVKLPGMKSAKLSITNELITVMADDGPYAVLSGGITETTLDIEVLDLNSKAREDWFGVTTTAGVEKYTKNLTPNDVAVMFRTRMEDGKAIWVGLLKGKFSIPGMKTKTKEGAPDPQPDTTTGNFVARGDADTGDILYIGREDNPEFVFDDFKKMVFPTATV